eukprot:2055172-Pyramimonas_sp.AAC.1
MAGLIREAHLLQVGQNWRRQKQCLNQNWRVAVYRCSLPEARSERPRDLLLQSAKAVSCSQTRARPTEAHRDALPP